MHMWSDDALWLGPELHHGYAKPEEVLLES